jgi:hypothetical protein
VTISGNYPTEFIFVFRKPSVGRSNGNNPFPFHSCLHGPPHLLDRLFVCVPSHSTMAECDQKSNLPHMGSMVTVVSKEFVYLVVTLARARCCFEVRHRYIFRYPTTEAERRLRKSSQVYRFTNHHTFVQSYYCHSARVIIDDSYPRVCHVLDVTRSNSILHHQQEQRKIRRSGRRFLIFSPRRILLGLVLVKLSSSVHA